ncbi:MAG TPA: prepilin-type N-terminal cleavage/methylation domain-containing protein [Pseudonocardiaceae bacterium]|nr:prepilin-type N-terminal cleavage/methylation domain-containing protein [Pseudonocardiaceae bacterium]
MYQRLREARANQSGFTLIELLIVIVILGVLAGIVVFAVQAFNGDGQAAACQTDKKSVEVAVEAYYAKNNSTYPTAMDQLTNGGYLREPPSTGNGYTISIGANGAVTATGACT